MGGKTRDPDDMIKELLEKRDKEALDKRNRPTSLKVSKRFADGVPPLDRVAPGWIDLEELAFGNKKEKK